jgi:hypothetical protein
MLNISETCLFNCLPKGTSKDVLQDVFLVNPSEDRVRKLVAGAEYSKSRQLQPIRSVLNAIKRSSELCHAPNRLLCKRECSREGRISVKVHTLEFESSPSAAKSK